MIKVLIVDDEAPIREWLVFCISKLEGFEVVATANHGAEGYSFFKKHLPDIVITDIRMPVMDGLEMMQMIQGVKQDLHTIVLTSHNDFEYARNALKLGVAEYILKTEITQKNIAELLEKCKRELEESSLYKSEIHYEEAAKRSNFLKGLILKQEEIIINIATLRQYDIRLENAPIFAIDIYFEHSKGLTGSKVILPKLDDICNITKLYFDFNHLIVIGNIKGVHSRRDQQVKCTQYSQMIIKRYPCKIGVSDMFDDVTGLRIAMIQAHNRVKLSFYKEHEAIFTYQDTSVTRPDNAEKLKLKFNKELVKKNFGEIKSLKNELTQNIESELPTDIEYVKKLYIFMITAIMRTLNSDINVNEEEISKISNKIMVATTFSEVKGVMENIFKLFSEKNEGDKKNYSHVINKAMHYINENYANPITLSEVANYVCLSSEYLSRLFKNEIGINFIVYLNNKRLESAIHMLETTNLKVYEIAVKVGYSNLSYFSTVFKKKFGINPFDYRNKRSVT